jgi:hydroxypyruvate isomerase
MRAPNSGAGPWRGPEVRFTANLGFLFTEYPFLDRFAAARAAGFERVECHDPYEHSIEAIRERLDKAGVVLTGLNTAPGDRQGEFGLAGVPGREDGFRRLFDHAVNYATALGCRSIHVTAGVSLPEGRSAALCTYVANMRSAANGLKGTGLLLLLEPLSTRPSYLVTRSDEVAAIIAEIGEPSVRMLFDVFHVHANEGDVLGRLRRHRDVIGHVQIAAVPSRAEPDEGELSLEDLLGALAESDYGGLIGLEYRPRGRTEDGLAWLKSLGC